MVDNAPVDTAPVDTAPVDTAPVDKAPVDESRPGRAWLRDFAFYLSAVISALFMVRLLGAGWTTRFPAIWPDAVFPKEGYLAVAAKSPFRPSFYFAFRPIGYPLLLWALRRDSLVTVVTQTAIYCAAVIALGAAAVRVLRSRVVGAITAVLIVGIAVQAKYAMWSTQILSESLAISLGFASLAAWWRFAAAPTRARAVWAWTFLIAFLLVRDAHVLPVTIVVVPVTLGVALLATSLDGRVRRTLAIGAVIVTIAAGYSFAATSTSHRAVLSLHNDVGVRILPDRELTKWFEGHGGMPVTDELRARAGKSGLDDDFYRSRDPALADYRRWTRGAGPRAVVLSLVALAPHYADLMNNDLPAILRADVRFYDTQSVYDRLPREMPLQLGGPTTRVGLMIWLALGVAALVTALVLARRRQRGLGVVAFGATALLITLIELYTTWAADPLEMQRHLTGALSRLSVILVIVIASAVDAAVTREVVAEKASAFDA